MGRDNPEQSTARRTVLNRDSNTLRERGVSDIVSFVLIFSLIIASSSLVATAGVDQLTELRDVERVQSSERAMEVAAADLATVQEGSPRTNLRFALNDGNIWVNESFLRVNVSAPGTETDSINGTYQVNSLEHRLSRGSQDVTVAYESGAVMRSDGATFEYNPRWQNDKDTVILTIVSLREGSDTINVAGGSFSEEDAIEPRRGVPEDAPVRDGGQTVQIAAESNFTEQRQWYIPLSGSQGNISVNVSETGNPNQWARSLERAGWKKSTNDEDVYFADAEETILLRQVVIELS